MSIYLDTENNQTVCQCNACETVVRTSQANGIVPDDWMTGQLWLDFSLSNQKQIPVCFCPTCAEAMKAENVRYQLTAVSQES